MKSSRRFQASDDPELDRIQDERHSSQRLNQTTEKRTHPAEALTSADHYTISLIPMDITMLHMRGTKQATAPRRSRHRQPCSGATEHADWQHTPARQAVELGSVLSALHQMAPAH